MTLPVDNPPIVFVQATFLTYAPEFANCTAAQGQNWFNRASMICTNEPNNPANNDIVNGTPALQVLLYLLTAHIGKLYAPRDAQGNPAATGSPAPPLVGRVQSAGEGSVNVSVDMGDATAGSPSQPWFMQTQYGAEYWTMSRKYMTAHWKHAPRHRQMGRFGLPFRIPGYWW